MRDDPDFGQRISKKTAEIKIDKQNILNAADTYGKQYQQEILEGTELRAKLLTEGSAKGLNEEQIMSSYGRFVPTVYTPILNLLFFMLRESDTQDSLKYRRRDAINKVLIETRQLNHDDKEPDISKEQLLSILDERLKEVHGDTVADVSREKINQRFASEEREKVDLKEPEDMETYLFGHLTLDQFNTLKKLKSLSCSENLSEATLAFQKGRELASKWKIDWEKVPNYYKKK